MKASEFNKICEEQMYRCSEILCKKASEYADDVDRLHNFKAAGGLTGETPRKALSGMMLKHTVSVYDMCQDEKTHFPMALWEEKITDHINYLLLLKAIVVEEEKERMAKANESESN